MNYEENNSEKADKKFADKETVTAEQVKKDNEIAAEKEVAPDETAIGESEKADEKITTAESLLMRENSEKESRDADEVITTEKNDIPNKIVAAESNLDKTDDEITTEKDVLPNQIVAAKSNPDEADEQNPKENSDKTGEKRVKPSFKEKIKSSLILFWTFFKLGLICFGGGYAMIALIEREIVGRKGWMTSEETLEIIAIAESTPGAIAINMSTYIGTKRAGILGAIFATLGVVLPSFLIIFAISFFIIEFKELKWVEYAFKGIRAAVLVLILGAVIKLFKQLERSIFVILCILGAFLLCLLTNLDIILVLLIFAAVGLLYNIIKRAVEVKKK